MVDCPDCHESKYCSHTCLWHDLEHSKICQLPWRACTDAEAEILFTVSVRQFCMGYITDNEDDEHTDLASGVWQSLALWLSLD